MNIKSLITKNLYFAVWTIFQIKIYYTIMHFSAFLYR